MSLQLKQQQNQPDAQYQILVAPQAYFWRQLPPTSRKQTVLCFGQIPTPCLHGVHLVTWQHLPAQNGQWPNQRAPAKRANKNHLHLRQITTWKAHLQQHSPNRTSKLQWDPANYINCNYKCHQNANTFSAFWCHFQCKHSMWPCLMALPVDRSKGISRAR